jgi:hypothetical protein
VDVIGERRLVFRPAGPGDEREILLRLGRPQSRLDDGWEVEIEIIDTEKSWKLPPVWGADGLGAILLGAFALSRYIEWYTIQGGLILTKYGDTAFPEWTLLLQGMDKKDG